MQRIDKIDRIETGSRADVSKAQRLPWPSRQPARRDRVGASLWSMGPGDLHPNEME
jgi:hypothetical protein